MTPEEAVKIIAPLFETRQQEITSMSELPDSYIISGRRNGLTAFGLLPVRLYKADGHYELFRLPDKDNFRLLYKAVQIPVPGRKFRKSSKLVTYIRNQYDGGMKSTPHEVSPPVLINRPNGCYIGAFIFYYGREELEYGWIDRPSEWLVCDIKTGDILHKYDARIKDFSDAPYDTKYNISMHGKKCDRSDICADRMYGYLDTARKEFLETGQIDRIAYREYRKMMLARIPNDYIRFFYDLEKV